MYNGSSVSSFFRNRSNGDLYTSVELIVNKCKLTHLVSVAIPNAWQVAASAPLLQCRKVARGDNLGFGTPLVEPHASLTTKNTGPLCLADILLYASKKT
jgi:hypothetical protein